MDPNSSSKTSGATLAYPPRVVKPAGVRIVAVTIGVASWRGGSIFYGVGENDIVYWYDSSQKEWIQL